MKNIELYGIREGLSMMDGLSGVKLGVFRAKASRIVEKLISDMESFMKSETWKKTDELLGEINKKHAKKDEKGNFVIQNNVYIFENPTDREREISDTKEKHKSLFKDRDKMATEYKDYLEQECTEKIEKIPLSILPANIKTEIVTLLWPIIDEKK